MKIKILSLILICFMFFPSFILTGCSSGKASIFITNMPSKIIYKVGDKIDLKGLNVESLNTDGTTTKQSISENDIKGADTSLPGEKTITISKDNYSTVFNIYVATKILSPQDNIKEEIQNSQDGDVIYLTQGNYENIDERLKDIVIDKKLFLIGDGKDKTIFNGNLIIGGIKTSMGFEKIADFEGVKIIGIGFNQNFKIKDDIINIDGVDKIQMFSAINGLETKNLFIENCSFKNFSNGIFMNKAEGLSVIKCNFQNLFISGITVKESTKNTTIYKNVFMDIGKNIVYAEDNKQNDLAMIMLGFNQKGNAGVIISKNTLNRMAQNEGNLIYLNENSKNFKDKNDLIKLSYMNNSSLILLFSSSTNNLQTTGIVLSANNYGAALQNIKIGKDENSQINQNGVIVNEDF